MDISGIYIIINIKNNHCYIGSSKNISKRFWRHLNELIKETHHCVPLQRAWTKYGQNGFTFNILEELPDITPDALLTKEAEWINKLNPEYNVGSVGGGDNISKHPNHAAICKRKSEIGKENWQNPSYRAKQIKRLTGEGNPNWKGGQTFCDCGARINSNTLKCYHCVDKSGEKNSFFGKHHSEKTKQLLRQKMKGRLPINSLKVVVNDVEYLSFAQAAKAYKVSVGTIRNWLKGRKPHNKIIVISLPHI